MGAYDAGSYGMDVGASDVVVGRDDGGGAEVDAAGERCDVGGAEDSAAGEVGDDDVGYRSSSK
jgi:hypothetical protein